MTTTKASRALAARPSTAPYQEATRFSVEVRLQQTWPDSSSRCAPRWLTGGWVRPLSISERRVPLVAKSQAALWNRSALRVVAVRIDERVRPGGPRARAGRSADRSSQA